MEMEIGIGIFEYDNGEEEEEAEEEGHNSEWSVTRAESTGPNNPQNQNGMSLS